MFCFSPVLQSSMIFEICEKLLSKIIKRAYSYQAMTPIVDFGDQTPLYSIDRLYYEDGISFKDISPITPQPKRENFFLIAVCHLSTWEIIDNPFLTNLGQGLMIF